LGGNNLGDDGTVSGEDDTERNEVSEKCVDPVPRTDEELDKLIVEGAGQIEVGLVAAWRLVDVQVVREEEMHVGAEQQDGDGGPDDNDTST